MWPRINPPVFGEMVGSDGIGVQSLFRSVILFAGSRGDGKQRRVTVPASDREDQELVVP